MGSPRLHPDTIEEIRQKLDIVEIISETVVLKKRGKSFLGLCPFHNEKTPSFSVEPDKQMYYCFGCQAGGNAIKFLMESRQQSYGEVLLDLARRYNITVRTLAPEQGQEYQRQLSLKEQLYEIMAVTVSFYRHALDREQGERALDYLLEKRKLKRETIDSFQLGYSPGGWETLYRYLVEQKRYPVGLVEKAGLIKSRQTGSGYYDRFRDRLMIPIFDLQGRPIAFGSRTLGNEEPKYINSPETPLFEKGKTLFALDRAKQQISKEDRAIVVEGYFDAIVLHEAGITNTVASLGTAFGSEQLKQLLRYTESKTVIFNFDADNAGVKATARAIGEIAPLVYSGQVQLKILTLAGGKDADEFLNSSPGAVESYRKSLDNAPFWLDWQIGRLLVGRDLKKANDFQNIARRMVEILEKLQDVNQRTHYSLYCAEILAGGDGRLIAEQMKMLNSQLQRPIVRKVEVGKSLPVLDNSEKELLTRAERLLISIYLHYPRHRLDIVEAMESKDLLFGTSLYRSIWQTIQESEATGVKPAELLTEVRDRLLSLPGTPAPVISLFDPDEQQQRDIDRPEVQIEEAIASLEKVTLDERVRSRLRDMRGVKEGDELYDVYLARYLEAKTALKNFILSRQGECSPSAGEDDISPL